VHAGAVALGEEGVLIRGAAGSGKSSLALALLAEWERRRLFAALVADDRTALEACAGRLVARPPPALAGRIEVRGAGILALRHVPAVRVTLVVDLLPDPERLPPAAATAEVAGIVLPCLSLRERAAACGALAVRACLDEHGLTQPDGATQRAASIRRPGTQGERQ